MRVFIKEYPSSSPRHISNYTALTSADLIRMRIPCPRTNCLQCYSWQTALPYGIKQNLPLRIPNPAFAKHSPAFVNVSFRWIHIIWTRSLRRLAPWFCSLVGAELRLRFESLLLDFGNFGLIQSLITHNPSFKRFFRFLFSSVFSILFSASEYCISRRVSEGY